MALIGQLFVMEKIKVRSMFGAFGVYNNGVIFGLIIDHELYFKTNKESENEFIVLDSEPFSYKKGDKIIKTSYWKVLEEIIENRDRLAAFAVKESKE